MLIKGRKSSRLAKSSDKSVIKNPDSELYSSKKMRARKKEAISDMPGIKSHKEKERHECPLCSKVYLNTKCLETHFETMHPDPEPSQTKVKQRKRPTSKGCSKAPLSDDEIEIIGQNAKSEPKSDMKPSKGKSNWK